jgi:hypothetical protein
VEVRVRDAAGAAASTWTDQDGNFYLTKANSNGVTLPASVGVRDAATTKVMVSMASNASCSASTCHVAGKQGPIHLP